MRSVYRQLSHVVGLAALAGVLGVTLAGEAKAATPPPRPSAGAPTVVGYSSERALRRVLAASGGKVVRRIPALHVAVVKSTTSTLQLLSGLPGIRYAQA